jgi:hypothetical protein
MVGCGGHRRRELFIDLGGARSKGTANQGKKVMGRSDQAGRPSLFLAQFRPVFLPASHLHILHLAPFIWVILRSSSLLSR